MNFYNETLLHNNLSSTRRASSLDNSELSDSYCALQFESQPIGQGLLQGEQDGPNYRVSSSSKVNFSKLQDKEKIIRFKNMAKEIKALKKKLRLMKARKLTKYEITVSLPQIQEIIKTYEKVRQKQQQQTCAPQISFSDGTSTNDYPVNNKVVRNPQQAQEYQMQFSICNLPKLNQIPIQNNQIIGMYQSSNLQFKMVAYRNDLFDKVVEYSTSENQKTAQFQTTNGSQLQVQVSTQQILNLEDNSKVQMKFQQICSQLKSQKPHFSGKANINYKNKEGNQKNKQIFKIVKIINKY
eukprot:403335000